MRDRADARFVEVRGLVYELNEANPRQKRAEFLEGESQER